MSKYGVFSGPYFPVFELNNGKYGPEKTPYLETFYAVFAEKTPSCIFDVLLNMPLYVQDNISMSEAIVSTCSSK